VAWFLYFIRFFSDVLGLPNIPGFPDESEGIALYQELTGYQLQHLDWFFAWAAYRYAVVMVRLLHRPGVAENTPDDWTLHDNPMTRAFAELAGLAAPTPGP
jgi:aminoglycoside phosphotransferase (APT) family kinase protein